GCAIRSHPPAPSPSRSSTIRDCRPRIRSCASRKPTSCRPRACAIPAFPSRVEAERGLYRAAQLRAAAEVARVAGEARRAWVEAVAAGELAHYAQQVKEAAEASAEIAAQMARAGNLSRLTQSREH